MTYYFLVSRDRTFITRFFMYHCSIYDPVTTKVYHLSGRHGYVCENIEDFRKSNKILKIKKFESDKDITEYFEQCKKSGKRYNALTNNCEDFANGFYGSRISKQTELYFLSTFLYMLKRFEYE